MNTIGRVVKTERGGAGPRRRWTLGWPIAIVAAAKDENKKAKKRKKKQNK
jgi:hypothetical protein